MYERTILAALLCGISVLTTTVVVVVVVCWLFNTFLTKQIQLSYLPCIKYFDQPISVSFPIERNVHDGECLPLVSI